MDLSKATKHAEIQIKHFEIGINLPTTRWRIYLNKENKVLNYIQPNEAIIDEQS